MIPCTDFIPAYSELFTFLHKYWGKDAVCKFWEHLSDEFLGNLKELVETKGIRGCWDYWSLTLNEEAADFTMELDEENGVFRIVMNRCPSKGRLIEEAWRLRPYDDYCEHCDVLYRRIIEPLGYTCDLDLSESDRAMCSFTLRKTGPNP